MFRTVRFGATYKIEVLGSRPPMAIGQVELRDAGHGGIEIRNFRVQPQYRRQHLGTALIQRAVDMAKAGGYGTVFLEARPSDSGITAQALVRMYQKHGFKSTGLSAAGNPMLEFNPLGGRRPSTGWQPPNQTSSVQPQTLQRRTAARHPSTIGTSVASRPQPTLGARTIQRMDSTTAAAASRSAATIKGDISVAVVSYNHSATTDPQKTALRKQVLALVLELKSVDFGEYQKFKKLLSQVSQMQNPKKLPNDNLPAVSKDVPPPFDISAANAVYEKFRGDLDPLVLAGASKDHLLALCFNLTLNLPATTDAVMGALHALRGDWNRIKSDSVKRIGEELSKPKKWNEFKGVLGELGALDLLLRDNQLAPGHQIRVGKYKKLPEKNVRGLAQQDVDISFRDPGDFRHHVEVKYDPETLVNKIVPLKEIQALNLPMFPTDKGKEKLVEEVGQYQGLPKQAVAYELTRVYHSELKPRSSAKPAPKGHFVTWVVPVTHKWMLIFVSSAAEKLAALKQYLRLGPFLLSPEQLIKVQNSVRLAVSSLDISKRDAIIKDPSTSIKSYL